MRIEVAPVTLRFAETFANTRGARDREEVVHVRLSHEGITGFGEGAPVTYLGESQASMLAWLRDNAQRVAGDRPARVDEVQRRLHARPGDTGAKSALECALHDWLGKRAGLPLWRLLGLRAHAPRTSFTVAIDDLEGTLDRVARHGEFAVLKLKIGAPDDVERLEAVRRATGATLRVDVNEGWDLETALAVMPDLVRLGVEFLEQPFPAADRDAYRALRALRARVPVVLDESVQGPGDVAAAGGLADGVSVKLEKAGGARAAMRTIAAAREHGLGVMLSCMLESQLGLAHAVQIASLADWADLDGHFLVRDQPFAGLRFEDGRVLPSDAPGLGVAPTADGAPW